MIRVHNYLLGRNPLWNTCVVSVSPCPFIGNIEIPPPPFNLRISSGGGTRIISSLGGGILGGLIIGVGVGNIPGALPKFLGLIVLVKGAAPLSVEYGV